MDCTVLILTYNNPKNLIQLLPTVKAMLAVSGNYSVSVSVIQNGQCNESERLTVDYGFTYIQSDNRYLYSYNPIVKKCTSETVFLLNDDLKLSKNILNSSLPFFKKDKFLFAVSCLFFDWGTESIQLSYSTLTVNNGWMRVNHEKKEIPTVAYSFYGSGGGTIYRTEMFNRLDGFDPIYWPAYYEDGDLCHRAWKRGWTTIVNPKATIEHRAGDSWKRTKKSRDLSILQQRNKILGMLLSCDNDKFLAYFFFFLPYRLLYSLIFQHQTFIAYIKALMKLGRVLKKRLRARKDWIFCDEQLMHLCGKIYLDK